MLNSKTLGLGSLRSAALGRPAKQTVLAPRSKRTNGVHTMAIGNLVKPASGKDTKQNGSQGQSDLCLHGDLSEDILRKARNIGALDLGPADTYRGTAQSVREHLIEAFNKTQEYWR